MDLDIDFLKKVFDKLPLPGSINFKNHEKEFRFPLIRNVGMISNADGTGEYIKKCDGELLFKKGENGWKLFIPDQIKTQQP